MADTESGMADIEREVADNGKSTLNSELSIQIHASSKVVSIDEERKENQIHLKGQELPEPIRKEGKGMMPCLPAINLIELTTILRDPSMPSQKILNEVADKIMLKSEESESDDGSVSSSGGVVGMKGLLDCIFEVSYMQEDSDNSEDEYDSFERIPRELPCHFCNKVFGSTMTWNTHVLVAHPEKDSSVLNVRRMSTNKADSKERNVPHRRHHRGASKVFSLSAADGKQVSELPHEEKKSARKRRSSKSQQKDASKGKSEHKCTSPAYQKENQSLSEENKVDDDLASSDLAAGNEDAGIKFCEDKREENAGDTSSIDQPFDQNDNDENVLAKKKCKRLSTACSEEAEQTSSADYNSESRKDTSENQQISPIAEKDQGLSCNASVSDVTIADDDQPRAKKRTASLLDSSSLPTSPSKCSRKDVIHERCSSPSHEQFDRYEPELKPSDN